MTDSQSAIDLTSYEQAEILRNPKTLAILMDYHDRQQDQADSMGAECVGDELRREQLRQHGAKLIEADPDIWTDDIRAKFTEPTGYAAQRLARAREVAAGKPSQSAAVADEQEQECG